MSERFLNDVAKIFKKELGTEDVALGAGKTKEEAYNKAKKELPSKSAKKYKEYKEFNTTMDGMHIYGIAFTLKEKSKEKKRVPGAHRDYLSQEIPFEKF